MVLSSIIDFILTEILLVIVAVVVVSTVLYTLFWLKSRQLGRRGSRNPTIFRGYQTDNPEIWKYKFCKANGKSQSPVNLNMKSSLVIPAGTHKPLIFNQQYFNLPQTMTIMNDGYGVLLGTCFENEYPTLCGGPLRGRYRFNVAQFKWGPTDQEGSEHTVNSRRFALELQLMHIKGDRVYENLDSAVTDKAVLLLSYFFEVTPTDNPYLRAIVDSLPFIRCPNESRHLDVFPLCWLFHTFRAKYFFYQGSITCPPCTEGVDWIVQPEPLSISSKQLETFRNLNAIDGPMLRNTRPTQKLNNRTIYFYD